MEKSLFIKLQSPNYSSLPEELARYAKRSKSTTLLVRCDLTMGKNKFLQILSLRPSLGKLGMKIAD